ncbi:hypothetical protein EVAR_82978_1 [Eumeta japonica]|uniref:Uncharacterized protein n=1 Tax=Eumeta variegata TaxID=151549 RepID=A0A4C1VPH6_EUMVA|nr:hypothetical protein EVAR_82978_1 [Eumeta japonica]
MTTPRAREPAGRKPRASGERELHNSNSVFFGLSSDIQNDLIKSIAQVIRDEIKSEINFAKFVSVIADETPDISHREQMSVIFRYLTKTGIEERFVVHWLRSHQFMFNFGMHQAVSSFNREKATQQKHKCKMEAKFNIMICALIVDFNDKRREIYMGLFRDCFSRYLAIIRIKKLAMSERRIKRAQTQWGCVVQLRSSYGHLSAPSTDPGYHTVESNETKLDGVASLNYVVPMATFQLHQQTLVTIQYQSTRQDESNEPKLNGVASFNYGVPMTTCQLKQQILVTIQYQSTRQDESNGPKLDGVASLNYVVPMATFQLHQQTLVTIQYQSTRQDESNEPKLDGVVLFNYGVPMATFQLHHQISSISQ